ncbi:hypothetical protein QE152_g14019 [Popillia japonica]|uniref:Peptidase A2 domain-containing protein n=1 Tax=Popillia japonica TaxID=7064 RepID=A0AAW1L839_POPJA
MKQENKNLREKSTRKVDRVTKVKHYSERKYPQCGRCGKKPSYKLKECPAIKEICLTCAIKGHYAKMCKTKNKNGSRKARKVVNAVQESSEETESTEDEIDTGADGSILSWNSYQQLTRRPKLKRTCTKLRGPGNQAIRGKIQIPIKWNEEIRNFKMFVIDTQDNLLGRPAIEELNLIKLSISEIESDGNANPYSISTPRRVPIPLLPKVEDEQRKMVDQDITEEAGVNNPSLWCAPMICVPKTGQIRILLLLY